MLGTEHNYNDVVKLLEGDGCKILWSSYYDPAEWEADIREAIIEYQPDFALDFDDPAVQTLSKSVASSALEILLQDVYNNTDVRFVNHIYEFLHTDDYSREHSAASGTFEEVWKDHGTNLRAIFNSRSLAEGRDTQRPITLGVDAVGDLFSYHTGVGSGTIRKSVYRVTRFDDHSQAKYNFAYQGRKFGMLRRPDLVKYTQRIGDIVGDIYGWSGFTGRRPKVEYTTIMKPRSARSSWTPQDSVK